MCRMYGVTRSGYYAWRRRGAPQRQRANAMLLQEIKRIYRQSAGTYGSPRVHHELHARGQRCGCKRVARLMRDNGLRGRVARVYRRQPGLKRFYRLGNQWRGVKLTRTDQVWVADITYLRAGSVRWYLAVIMDVYSRRVVGWALGRKRDQTLTGRALIKALDNRRPSKGVIFHSDRGIEYLGSDHRQRLLNSGFQPSSNRVRHPEDNNHMESFNHTLKAELVHRRRFNSYRALYLAVRRYLEFYNQHRLHSSLGYRSPQDYEKLSA